MRPRFSRPDSRLVLIEWVDSHGGDEWKSVHAMERGAAQCLSVGWLMHEGKDSVMVVPHLGIDDGETTEGRGEINIPRVAINRIRLLREGRAA